MIALIKTRAAIYCITNSYLNPSFKCECNPGFNSSNNCLKSTAFFSVIYTLTLQNNITLYFTEPPKSSYPVLKVILKSLSLPFSQVALSPTSFNIEISYPDTIKKDSIMFIYFDSNLQSLNNSILAKSYIEVILFPTSTDSVKISSLIQDAQTMATTGITSGLSIAFGTSALCFDPTSFFSFISTAETLYPISLFSAKLPQDLKAFLASVRVQQTLPNVFKWLVRDEQ